MLVSIFARGAWLDQPTANVRRGASQNIWYLTLPVVTLDHLPGGHGSLRVALDGVEGLAVSALGPSEDARSMEFIVVMPTARGATRAGQVS
jgi:hypothetical protein